MLCVHSATVVKSGYACRALAIDMKISTEIFTWKPKLLTSYASSALGIAPGDGFGNQHTCLVNLMESICTVRGYMTLPYNLWSNLWSIQGVQCAIQGQRDSVAADHSQKEEHRKLITPRHLQM